MPPYNCSPLFGAADKETGGRDYCSALVPGRRWPRLGGDSPANAQRIDRAPLNDPGIALPRCYDVYDRSRDQLGDGVVTLGDAEIDERAFVSRAHDGDFH